MSLAQQAVEEIDNNEQVSAKIYDTKKLIKHIQSMIADAKHHHMNGRLHEAEIAYEQILNILPDNVEILQMRGVLNTQLQRNDIAEAMFTKALNIKPESSNSHLNLANILLQLDKKDEALIHYESAIKFNTNNAEAYSGLGALLFSMECLDKAMQNIEKSLLLNPLNADAHSNKANILVRQEEFSQAEQVYYIAIGIDHLHINSYINLSCLYRNQKRFEEAEALLKHVLNFDSENIEAHVLLCELYEAMQRHKEAKIIKEKVETILPNQAAAYMKLSEVFWQSGQIKKSEQCLRQAIQLEPENIDALCNLAANLLNAEKVKNDEAKKLLQKALKINSKHIDACINMANCYTNEGNYWRACLLLKRVHKRQPHNINALCNLGYVYWEFGDYEKAANMFKECIKHEPNHAEAHTNLGMCSLILGNYEQGWAEYEWRLHRENLKPTIDVSGKRLWNGEEIKNKRLCVYTEQGFGDTIQLMRLLPQMQKKCKELMIFVPKKLVHLIHQLSESMTICHDKEELPDFDCYVSLWSLPARIGLNNIKDFYVSSYLKANKEKAEVWRERLSKYENKRVAIFWQGSKSNRTDAKRSFSLDTLSPLFELDNIHIISLQKGDGIEQIENFEYKDKLICFNQFDNMQKAFEDSMAILENIDILVTCDSAIAHVAGAMGKKVYLLLAKAPDFRWGSKSNISEWYPSIELFRQEKHRNWTKPILTIKEQLS